MAIALPVPSALIQHQLGNMPPQVQFDMRSDGQPTYQGWASPNSSTSDSTWIVTKYLYDGSNRLTHYSTLVNIVWSLRALYTFP